MDLTTSKSAMPSTTVGCSLNLNVLQSGHWIALQSRIRNERTVRKSLQQHHFVPLFSQTQEESAIRGKRPREGERTTIRRACIGNRQNDQPRN
jgi:hypothetical protein